MKKQQLKSEPYMMNRELSWLKFNERVLEEAENPEVPLCERMTFVSIYQSNLDEFFRVRVGSLQDQMLISTEIRENKTKMTSAEQIRAIIKEVKKLNQRKDKAYEKLMKKIEEYGITLINHEGDHAFKFTDNRRQETTISFLKKWRNLRSRCS